ncbi:MAG: ABC transporter permease [Bacteroidetes bacterium]|jgi:phospholipid/cholesterol/gamma-HCH transport system permease protein|nr:ABC transporter permease [Bacteroidota bacterium]
MYAKELFKEMNKIGIGSLGIVILISVFLGMVTTLQTAYQLIVAWIPASVIGEIVTETAMLELAPTITGLVLAGRVGSSLASELGTMRVKEQIDALDVMGVNSAAFLVFPKILASLVVIPMLILISTALMTLSGAFIGNNSGIVPYHDFVAGAIDIFKVKVFILSMTKAYTFAFMISSISCYQGYYSSGGATGVGKSSTRAVVWSCVLILFSDYIIAQLFL